MEVYGSIWKHMESIWECMGVYGSVWKRDGSGYTNGTGREVSITIGTPSTASTTTPNNDCLHLSIRINVDECNGIWVIVVAFGVEGRIQRLAHN